MNVRATDLYRFNDTGLMAFFLGVDKTTLSDSPFTRALWETFIYAELRKRNATAASPKNIWFYRDQFTNEIDFVLDSAGKLSFVEVKWSENPPLKVQQTLQKSNRDLRQSKTFKAGTHYLLCRTPYSYSRDRVRVCYLEDMDELFER